MACSIFISQLYRRMRRFITIKMRIDVENLERMLDKADVVSTSDSTDPESKIKKWKLLTIL